MNPEELVKAHHFFAVTFFNEIWGLIDKPERTPQDNEFMLHLAHSSLLHWSNNPEINPSNWSIGYWMLSRVYSLNSDGENALKYAEKSYEYAESGKLDPFFTGYAYEAMARGFLLTGDEEKFQEYLQKALDCAKNVTDKDSQELLLTDLKEMEK